MQINYLIFLYLVDLSRGTKLVVTIIRSDNELQSVVTLGELLQDVAQLNFHCCLDIKKRSSNWVLLGLLDLQKIQ